MVRIVFQYPRGEPAEFLGLVGRQYPDGLYLLCIYLHGHRGRNVCLAFLAQLPCAGCSYSHQRHDVSTLDDELEPIVQQKLQEIQSWLDRTQQRSLSPAPASSIPVALAPPPMANGDYQPQAAYTPNIQSSFANLDPSKVVEFKPRGLQLLTPTSPQSQEIFASAPNEEPAASTIEPVQDNAAFETAVDWGTVWNGDGWSTPRSNPGANAEDRQPEESTEGNQSTAKFDWAEDAERTLSVSPLIRNISLPTHPTVEGKAMIGNAAEEPVTEIVEEVIDAWTAEYSLSGGGWSAGPEDTANGWDDPPKVAEPTGDISWDIPPSNEKWDSKGANENDWGTVPWKGKKSKSLVKKTNPKTLKTPPLTPKPKDKDNGFHKGTVEKDRKTWGKGWKEERLVESTNPWNGGKKGKNGGKPSSTPPAVKPFGPAKEKCRDIGPKDAFTFNRVTPFSSSAAPQSTRNHEEEPDLDSLPELPPDLKAKGYPPEFQKVLRQAIVPKCKMPDRPSVAPLPEDTNNDKGMNWVNGTLEPGWNMDTPKEFSERKVQTDETNGWHPVLVKRSKSKTSPPTVNKVETWPKLGK